MKPWIYLCYSKLSSNLKQSSEARCGGSNNTVVVPALILGEMLCGCTTAQPYEHSSLYWCVAMSRPRRGSYSQDAPVLFTNQITAWVCLT